MKKSSLHLQMQKQAEQQLNNKNCDKEVPENTLKANKLKIQFSA